MKKITHTITCILLVLFAGGMKAQISGVVTVPGSYASIAAVINTLNTSGVSGAVTVNIAAGYTETAIAGGYTLNAITGASAGSPIIFQKSGSGANPIIYAYTGGTGTPATALQDGVWRFNGTDYVTINGIDITDLNTSNPATMEFGYGFFKASVTDGCQNNVIKNCTITLNRINNVAGSGPAIDGSRGIDMVNATIAAHTTALTITNATGSNSNNQFYSNTIQNCQYGISMIGYADSSPFSKADTGNDIGGSSTATGNTIINYGGNAISAAAGIRTLAQYSVNISYNTINNNNGSGVTHSEVLRGIFNNTATSANVTITNNTITLQSNGSSQSLIGITNAAGSTAASNSVVISNNMIANCTNTTAAASFVFNAIINSASAASVTINGNTVNNINLNSTGTCVFFETTSPTNATVNSNTVTNVNNAATSGQIRIFKITSPTNATINNNLVDNINWTNLTSSGATDGFYTFSSPVNVSVSNNIFRNFTTPTTGLLEGIREFGVSGNKVMQNNQIYNFNTTPGGAGGGTFYGIYLSTGNMTISANSIYSLTSTGGVSSGVNGIIVSGGTSANIYKNKIYNLSATGTSAGVIGININGGTTNSIFNNLVSNLFTPATTFGNFAIVGIFMNAGTTNSAYYNTVLLSGTSSGAPFGATAFWGTTGATLDMRNNILVNNIVPTGAGLNVAYYRTSTTISSYSTTSNNNLFYAGTPSSSNYIFWDGTNLIPTLSAYKVFLSNTRDAASVSENPNFLSTVGANANFLNINTTIPTQIESGGTPVSGITDDYAGTTRNVTTPDIGAFEGTYVISPACSGVPAVSSLTTNASAVCPSVAINLLTLTNYTNSGITYQWLASTTSSSSGFAAVPGATNAVLSNTNLTATTFYELSVTCSNSGSTSISAPLQITLGPPSFSTVSNNTFLCTGQTANLSLSGSLSGLTYQYLASTTSSTSGFVAVPNATNSTLSTTNTPGNVFYETALACSANTALTSTTTPIRVTFGAVPTATAATSAATLCAASNLTLTGTTDIGTAFTWKGPNNYTSTAQNPSFTNASTGTYTFIAALNTCSSTAATVAVVVNGKLFLNTPIATPSAICLGATSQLQVTDYASAKINRYNFTNSTGAGLLTLPAASTVIAGGDDDTPMAAPASLGFTFNFNGVDYTQYTASPDGWIMLGGAIGANEFTNNTISTNNIPKIYPYWDDLATGVGGYVRTQLLGAAPNRTFVAEWFVTIPRNTTGAANSTFQALLYEATGQVEFRYGTLGSGSMSASTGMTGDATTFQSLTLTGPTTSTVTPNDNNTGQPATGTSYVFSPPTVTYSWSPSATLSSSTLAIVTSTPSGSTTYSVVETFEACPLTRTVAVNILTPVISISGASGLCLGQSATLTASGATTYTWVNTGANTASIVDTPTSTTTYTIIGSTGGCSSQTTQVVNVAASLNIGITGPNGACIGSTVGLTATGGVTYTFNTGATTSTIAPTFTGATTYSVIGASGTCSNSAVKTISVNPTPTIAVSGTSVICAGQSTTLSASGGSTYVFAGPNATVSANTVSATVAPTSNAIYTVTGTSSLGCSISLNYSVNVNAVPVLTVAQSPTAVCVGNAATLTATGANSTYTFTGGPTSSVNPIASATAGAVYTVTGANATGCSSTQQFTLNTINLPVITVTPASPTICASTSVNLTASGAGTSGTYSFVGGPATNTYVVNPLNTTTYTVSGTATTGCIGTKTVVVTTNTLPVIAVSPATQTICSQSAAVFSVSGTTSYSWSTLSTAPSITVFPVNNTTYTVTGTNAAGCSSSATVAATTLSLPVISVAPSLPTVCVNAPTTFTASGATTYTWATGVATGSTAVITSTGLSSYSVSGTGPNNCVASTQFIVFTNPLPVLAVSASAATVCATTPVTFTASGANTYSWNTGTGANGIITYSPTSSSVYTVTGTNTVTGCVGTQTVAVATNPLPIVTITPASPSVCAHSSLMLSASGASTYVWSNTSINNNITVIATTTANLSYTVTGTDAIGCSNTQTVMVTVNPLPVLTAPSLSICVGETATYTVSGANTYTWNGTTSGATYTASPNISAVYIYTVSGTDNNNCVNKTTVSLDVRDCLGIKANSFSGNLVSVYPNPSTGAFTAKFDFAGEKTVMIMDVAGKVISQSVTSSTSQEFNLSEMAKGVYFVKISTKDASGNYKLIIE